MQQERELQHRPFPGLQPFRENLLAPGLSTATAPVENIPLVQCGTPTCDNSYCTTKPLHNPFGRTQRKYSCWQKGKRHLCLGAGAEGTSLGTCGLRSSSNSCPHLQPGNGCKCMVIGQIGTNSIREMGEAVRKHWEQGKSHKMCSRLQKCHK